MKCCYLLSILSFILLTGCTKGVIQTQPHIDEPNKIKSLPKNHQSKSSGWLDWSLTKLHLTHKDKLIFTEIKKLIKSGDNEEAQIKADLINKATLSKYQRNQINLLYAQISLNQGKAMQALNTLNTIQPYKFKVDEQIIFYKSMAFAYSLIGKPLQSVQAYTKVNYLLSDTKQRYKNTNVILNILKLVPAKTLLLKQPPAPSVLGGWMALTRLLIDPKLKQNPKKFQTKILEWQQLFPSHPADLGFLQFYFKPQKDSLVLPKVIALLLPKSGSFAKSADIIKLGFIFAYTHDDEDYQPYFRFYDSTSDNIINLYNRIIAEGAKLIVGPLSKDNIERLALDTKLTIPVLALNHVQNLAKNNLFQFGLSPIDEIQQISDKANQDGHKKVLLLMPDTNHGYRTVNYLKEYWQSIDGTILDVQFYDTKKNDFSAHIKNLLNLDESKNRYTKLKRFLAIDINYTERRRQDVEAIFLSANPQIVRSIYPQLRFYRANRLPVYVTSQIYSNRQDTKLAIDLNNITFCDIPWLLTNTYLTKPLLQRQFLDAYSRLFALGIDSFNVIKHLAKLDTIPYSGVTGKLLLNWEHRISRKLICAKIIAGKPVVLEDFFEHNYKNSHESIQ